MFLFNILARFLFDLALDHYRQLEICSYTNTSEIHDKIKELGKGLDLFKDFQGSMLESEYRLILDNATDLSCTGWQTLSYILLYRIVEIDPFYEMLKNLKEKLMFSCSFEEFFEARGIEYTFYLRMLVASYSYREHFKEFVTSLFTLLGMDGAEISGLSETLVEFYYTLHMYIQRRKSPLPSIDRFRVCVEKLNEYRAMCLTKCKLLFGRELFDSTKHDEIIWKLLTRGSLDK